jgi:SAM-dependent methyltransferase
LPPGHEFAGRILAEPLPGGSLYACATCHVSFRWPLTPKEKLDALYRQAELSNWSYEPRRREDWIQARDWLQAHHDGGSILDIGCFDGGFLEYLGEGWARFGVEINEEAARIAQGRGIEIIGNDVEALTPSTQQFDAVVAFDVIEHLPVPKVLLEKMVALARPGGAVILATGNTQAPSWRLMGSRYWYCRIPEHIAFINTQWCQQAAADLGLELVHVGRFSHAPSRTLRQQMISLGKNLVYRFFPGLFRRLRQQGFGGVEVAKHAGLEDLPPIWITARDQLVATFQRAA